MVGDERLGRRPARDRLHHGRLHLEEAPGVEERAQRRDQAALHHEGLADLGVHDQVHVAAPVARLHVLEAVPLLGQRAERLGEELELLDRHRELAGAGAEELAGDAHEVPHVEVHERGVGGPQHVGAGVELDLPGLIPQHREAALAVVAHRHHPTGQGHRPRALQHGLVGVLEARLQGAGPVGDREARAERVDPARPPRLQFFPPPAHELVRRGRRSGRCRHGGRDQVWDAGRAAVRKARMNGSSPPSITASTLPTSTPVRWSLMIWYGAKV